MRTTEFTEITKEPTEERVQREAPRLSGELSSEFSPWFNRAKCRQVWGFVEFRPEEQSDQKTWAKRRASDADESRWTGSETKWPPPHALYTPLCPSTILRSSTSRMNQTRP